MIDKETYGIEAEVKTSRAKRALKDLANDIRSFGKQAEKETKITYEINPNIPKSELLSWQKDLQRSLRDAQLDLANYRKTPTEKYYQEEVDNLQEGLQLVNNRLQEIEQSEQEVDNGLKDIEASGSKTSSMLSRLFDKSIGKIKRFTYYLLGARSVFALFRKYQSIYFQYNEQMQYQTELSQNAIALSLAPAFEFLSNVITYASIAFAKFIELLTGVNVLSKVTTKGIRDYNKSLKETQTLVSGIDEITNLSLPSGTGLGDQYKALGDFQKKIAEVEEWINKIKKGFWSWLDPSEFAKYVGDKGIVTTVLNLLNEQLKGVYERVFKKYVDRILDKLKNDLEPIWTPLKTYLQETIDNVTPMWEDLINPLKEKIKTVKNMLLENMRPFLNVLIDVWNDTFGWLFGKIDRIEEKVEETNSDIKEDVKTTTNSVNQKIDTVQENIEDIGKQNVTFGINANLSSAENKLKQFFAKLGITWGSNSLNTTIGLSINAVGGGGKGSLGGGGFSGGGSREYANGLDYVPYDEYPALLHKGEAVVPAKYNPTIHSQGNEYTNSLLEELVIKMDDLAKRPNIFEIDGQQFASATYSLYDNEALRQNYVEGVVR